MVWKIISLEAVVRMFCGLLGDTVLDGFSIHPAQLRGGTVKRHGRTAYNVMLKHVDEGWKRYRFYTFGGFGGGAFEELTLAKVLEQDIPTHLQVYYDRDYVVALSSDMKPGFVPEKCETIDGRKLMQRRKQLVSIVEGWVEDGSPYDPYIADKVEEAQNELRDLYERGLVKPGRLEIWHLHV